MGRQLFWVGSCEYAPQADCKERQKEEFWEEVNEFMQR